MKKVALITGITGQDGSYLAELLLEKEYKIYGIVRRTSLVYNYTRLDKIRKEINLSYGDMTDGSALLNYINQIIKENEEMGRFEIYNLAAQSHVHISFEIPEYTSLVDGIGTLKILDIIKSLDKKTRDKVRFYQAGTSELYGKVLETPQKETTPFNPVSPYASAKLYAYYITKNYREAYNLYAVNGILFNHCSPRRGNNFLTMKVVKGVKDIVEKKKEYIEVGNIFSYRDEGHAKDYVRGMWLMLQQEEPDDFVLASGETYSVKYFIEKAFLYKGYKIRWKEDPELRGIDQNGVVRVKINQKYFRPNEVDLLHGNPEKAEKKLGWKREYDTLEKIIESMFEEE